VATQTAKDLAMDDLSRPSFLSYRGAEPPLAEPSRRVYARVEQIEPTASTDLPELAPFAGEEVALMDAVDADWFDVYARGRERLADERTVDDADEHVSVVALRELDLRRELGEARMDERAWIEVELDGFGAQQPALQYLNLFAAPIERRLRRAAWVLPPLERELAVKTSMEDVPDASEEQLAAVFDGIGRADAAAVYDVGQGGCNAILSGSTPSLYFDFGGGVLANRNTFPADLVAFCFTQRAPVLLSHWDWDHWSSANRDPEAYQQTWIVPRQDANGLGAVHRTFLARLRQNGTVLVWPRSLSSLNRNEYEVVQCVGPAHSRNDSGLALVLNSLRTETRERMLFPGDCRYDHIPAARAGAFTSLVCPHHGGRTSGSFVPAPDGNSAGRLVYSYGLHNSHGHPFPAVRADHLNAGWHDARETPHRSPPLTPQPLPHRLGHVHLYWDSAALDQHPGCAGRSCQLTCHQR
jgi:hypothetical protein